MPAAHQTAPQTVCGRLMPAPRTQIKAQAREQGALLPLSHPDSQLVQKVLQRLCAVSTQLSRPTLFMPAPMARDRMTLLFAACWRNAVSGC